MEAIKPSERSGVFFPASSVAFPMDVKFTEIPESEESRKIIQASLAYRVRRESSSERVGDSVSSSYVDVPLVQKLTERHDSEVLRMMYQARLGNRLRRDITRRFLSKGRSSSADSSGGKKFTTADSSTPLLGGPREPKEQLMHEDYSRVNKLDQLIIFPMTEQQSLVTLEAHVNGFLCTSPVFRFVIMNANVRGCFVRLGAYSRYLSGNLILSPQAALHFCLHHPIMVGAKETKDIHFRLPDNEKLESFVKAVGEFHWGGGSRSIAPITPIDFEALEECEFVGVFPMDKVTAVSLTYSALVIVKPSSFVVFPLDDIEIVNLALSQPQKIDMTVVFKDFKCPVLEIQSVDSEFLTSIKQRLNFAQVKYYVNGEKRDWNLLARKMFESPEAFTHETLCLEDSSTLAFYPDEDSGSDSDFLEK